MSRWEVERDYGQASTTASLDLEAARNMVGSYTPGCTFFREFGSEHSVWIASCHLGKEKCETCVDTTQ